MPGRQVIFSAYHQSPRTLPLYVGELRRRRLPWLHGYPSVLALLASYLETSGEDLGYEPRWVTTGAESLLPQQAEVIGRAFGVRPIEHYGEEEAVANASQCEHGFLHIDEDFSYVELLPWTGTGEQQIVGTSLCNPATVLLRYELTDTVRTHPGQCSCGRWGRRLEAVDGRVEDYLSLPDGSKIGRMDHVFKDMTSIHEAQIVQLEPGHIKVLVVPRPSWGPEAQRHLLEEIRTRVGGSLRVEFETCEAIPRTGAGKLRLVVSSPSCASSSR